MRKLALFVCVLSFSSALAKPTFEEKKEKMIQRTDERIKELNEKKSCISSAESEEALKSCQAQMKMKRLEKREGRMKKRMEKRKAKLKSKANQ